jgi:hypothetical protein
MSGQAAAQKQYIFHQQFLSLFLRHVDVNNSARLSENDRFKERASVFSHTQQSDCWAFKDLPPLSAPLLSRHVSIYHGLRFNVYKKEVYRSQIQVS